MAKSERNIEELLAHAKELKQTADRLIQQSQKLMDEYDRLSVKPQRSARVSAKLLRES